MVTPTETPNTGADTANQGTGEATQSGTDQTFTIEVNGEPTTVTLEELQAGYLRQADYTRKTTDVANQRKELEPYVAMKQAFDENPAVALETVSTFYGVNQPSQQAPGESQNLWDEPEGTNVMQDDPRIAQLENQIQALTTNQAAAELDKAAQALVQTYPDADTEAVKRHAAVNGFPSLESAYRDLAFTERDEAYQAQQRRLQAEQGVIEAKRNAGVVSQGTGAAAGSVAQTEDHRGKSLKDLLRQEFAEQGVDFSNPGWTDLSLGQT